MKLNVTKRFRLVKLTIRLFSKYLNMANDLNKTVLLLVLLPLVDRYQSQLLLAFSSRITSNKPEGTNLSLKGDNPYSGFHNNMN